MITVRRYKRRDARAVAALISGTYARFNAGEGTRDAVRHYVESYSPKGKKAVDLHNRFSRTPLCFVAVSGEEVVGVVRGLENRLVNLFVDGKHHRQGIATRLVQRFEKACLTAGFTEIVLRGSLYATPFYEAVGYRKTTGVRDFHGLKVQPMRKRLK
jgi:GNAT superfamily N-acetyltransferase